MSGLQRIIGHPDRGKDQHARARELASEALRGQLGEADAIWLDEHLTGCDACQAMADAFAADAELLRGLRDDLPAVPRDLGARVSLALDDEVRRATGGRRRREDRARERRPSMRRPGLALAGIAAAAIVALVVAPLAIPLGAPVESNPPVASLGPGATPIVVDTKPVAWVSRAADGSYTISSARVGEVCPGVDSTACGTLDGSARTVGSLTMKPSSIAVPRDGTSAVVVGQNSVYAVSVDLAPPVTTAAPSPSPVPTSQPAQSPAASGEPASPPVDSPAPSESPASPSPSESASPPPVEPTPSLTPSPAETPSPSAEPGGPTPVPTSGTAGGDATAETPAPTAEPTPEVTPEPPTPLPTMPPATPAPTAAAAVTIADKVILVGASPAYSPDGRWVAFSARPADGSHGPDVYVWRVGGGRARTLTDDHGSIFSGWLDDQILASAARYATSSGSAGRKASDAVPPADADPASIVARSFLLDPSRGVATEIPGDGMWRPVVDPTERLVVYWSGSLAWDSTQRAWLPSSGSLVAADWRMRLGGSPDSLPQALPAEATGGAVVDWDVRFDPAGRRLGVWVADPADPGAGRLALVTVNDDGTLGAVVLSDAAALPGFSLDADRLAWSTPPGRNGQGSQVTVYAWRGDAAGQLRSVPEAGNEPVVVAH
jgi:Putative zinc-finger/WD40-like Beta Propeller Repeat